MKQTYKLMYELTKLHIDDLMELKEFLTVVINEKTPKEDTTDKVVEPEIEDECKTIVTKTQVSACITEQELRNINEDRS